MKKILVIIFVLIILAGIIFMIYKFWPKKNEENQVKSSQIKYSQVQIAGQEIKTEVADNEELRMKGLSGRETLCADCGLLFVFEKSDIYPFWMKEMNFSIDIIWIKDKKIVEIVKSAQTPEVAGKIMSYTPKAEADLVLEVNAGFCEKDGVKIEDGVKIK